MPNPLHPSPSPRDDPAAPASPAAADPSPPIANAPPVSARPDPRKTNFLVESYVPATLRAIANTLRHVFTVPATTIQYPDVKDVYPPGSRGEHYLKRDDHGRVRCVACYLCADICPADCIHIEAALAPPEWTDRDKYPARFEIDELRCIYCGMCEEACPCDAIALSTVHCISSVSREDSIYRRDRLLADGDRIGEQALSRCPTEGASRGRWDRDRELPPLSPRERALVQGE